MNTQETPEGGTFDIVEPRAAALAESLRAFGYDPATALADLADNSLFHESTRLDVSFRWDGERSAIAIGDDGSGMDEATLKNAMRVGSSNPRASRDPADLGRFGLGLKTASFSQCRRVTVFTRRLGDQPLVRCWDLDHIAAQDEWQLLRTASSTATSMAEQLLHPIHGTVVVWETLDRITDGTNTDNVADMTAFNKIAAQVVLHFGTVFHSRMSGKGAVTFMVNGHSVKPWDPFLTSETATQVPTLERIPYKNQIIEIQPYVLPHLSKLDANAHARAAGLRGWNAHQGFYVYSNGRLIVPGDWLGIKGWRQEEHYKLARIRIDLPNSMDHEWEIDVTKSRARPPEKLRTELTRIGEATRRKAKEIYSHRGARLTALQGVEREFLWEQRAKHNRTSYRLNREHPLLKQVKSSCTDPAKLSALLRLIEETIPIPLMLITDRESPDQAGSPFENSSAVEILEVMTQVLASLRSQGLPHDTALSALAQFEPFQRFPELVHRLEEKYNE